MEKQSSGKFGAIRKSAMKPIAMAKGGMVKKCVTGGKIAGPGGPTDDMVPIMASNGEFMIKASSAKILGEDVLEALNDLGDEPKNPKDDAAEDAKEGEMKTGGMVRKPVLHMFGGGGVDEELNKRLAQIPGSGTAPAPDVRSNGSDFKRNVGATPAAAPSLNAPWYLPEYARAANASDKNGLELEKDRRAAANPGDANDGLKNFILNGAIGSAATSNSAAPGSTPTKSSEAPAVASVDPQARAKRVGDPSSSDLNDPFSNAMIENRNPAGMVRKVVESNGTTSYTGGNVSGEVSFQDANGNAIPGRPGGGLSVIGGGMTRSQAPSAAANDGGGQTTPTPTMSPLRARLEALGAQPGKLYINQAKVLSQLQAQDNQRDASMANTAASERNKKAEIASQDKRNADMNAIEKEKLGMSRGEYDVKMKAAQKVQELQDMYLNGTPEEKALAAQQLNMLNGKQGQQDEYMTNVLTDANGVQSLAVTNKRTGQSVGAQGQQAAPQYEEGTISTVNGKSAKWIGGKWVPQ